MPTFRLTIRLLDAAFHGRGESGEPEWPPAPLRAFQALVNAAAGRWRPRQFDDYVKLALEWLEALDPPHVVAPPGRAATRPYRLYVPNNAGDLMVAAWARGNGDASMAEHRTEKDVRPTRFAGPDRRPLKSNPDLLPVHYDWPLTADQYEAGKAHEATLKAAARSITHLGWGVDQAVGHAELLPGEPPADPAAERWVPAGVGGAAPLRVPRHGTLSDLRRKHQNFLSRLRHGSFNPVPPLTEFRVVGYRRATDPAGRPWVAFRIASVDPDEATNPSFDPTRRCRDVAAWVRNATGSVCREWPDVATFVHGHDPADTNRRATGDAADARFMYLPLPTINAKLGRVESIRRVLLAVPPGANDRVEWVRRRLPGQELVDLDNRVRGMLTDLAGSDWVLRRYTEPAAVWSTVTPVLLPGYDDPAHIRRRIDDNRSAAEKVNLLERLAGRVEELLRKALRHAGYPEELIQHAELEWRKVGFRPGTEPADRYVLPDHLKKFPPYHVRVRWRDPHGRPIPVAGPVCVGAGRYYGLGLFAAEGSAATR